MISSILPNPPPNSALSRVFNRFPMFYSRVHPLLMNMHPLNPTIRGQKKRKLTLKLDNKLALGRNASEHSSPNHYFGNLSKNKNIYACQRMQAVYWNQARGQPCRHSHTTTKMYSGIIHRHRHYSMPAKMQAGSQTEI